MKNQRINDDIKILVIHGKRNFSRQINYVFDFIFSFFDVSYEVVSVENLDKNKYNFQKIIIIGYGEKVFDFSEYKYIHIFSSPFFGKPYFKKESLPNPPLKRVKGLPIIYPSNKANFRLISKNDKSIETHLDIVASVFFMLTRYEEVIIKKRDKHNRFPADSSLAFKEKFLDRPIVDEYVNFFEGLIKSLFPKLKRKKFWGDKNFAVFLTHDVDAVRKYKWYPPSRPIFSLLVKKREIKKAAFLFFDYLKAKFKKDPYNTFKYIIDLEKKNGLKSCFYFLKKDITKKDSNFLSSLNYVKERNFEVGLHPSFNSYKSLKKIKREKRFLEENLREKIYGVRQHFLRFEVPETWQIQENAGFLYDSTLGFAAKAGFRCGTCFPFQPFDLIENKKIHIWEIPLIMMDRTLQSSKYEGLSTEEAKKEIIKFVKIVKRFGGVFTLLWHNSSFYDINGWIGWDKVYQKSICHIKKQNVYVGFGKEILKNFSKQNSG